jgi:hypothetical protein
VIRPSKGPRTGYGARRDAKEEFEHGEETLRDDSNHKARCREEFSFLLWIFLFVENLMIVSIIFISYGGNLSPPKKAISASPRHHHLGVDSGYNEGKLSVL